MTETALEQISAQLGAITQQLTHLSEKQVYYDQALANLSQKTEIPTTAPVQNIAYAQLDLFRIPDPIKSIPSFDGNKKQVTSWLKMAEETLRMFEGMVEPQQFKMYLQAVKNKIEGKAKDIICLAGDPENFAEIAQILLEALGDKQELPYYKSQLWGNKQDEGMSVHTFFNKTKEIIQNIKSLARQNPIYSGSWHAICSFIEEDALAAFISGLRKPYFGYAQAAKPKNIEEAYAFLCKFNSNENIITNSKKVNSQNRTNNFQQRRDINPNAVNSQLKKQSWPAQEKHETVPMEVDPSLRSRRSFNKKVFNNHETVPDLEPKQVNPEDNSDPNPDSENFWEDHNSDSEG